ncbi:hypothetical protein GCM10009806_26160 [Microbacterium flavum]
MATRPVTIVRTARDRIGRSALDPRGADLPAVVRRRGGGVRIPACGRGAVWRRLRLVGGVWG